MRYYRDAKNTSGCTKSFLSTAAFCRRDGASQQTLEKRFLRRSEFHNSRRVLVQRVALEKRILLIFMYGRCMRREIHDGARHPRRRKSPARIINATQRWANLNPSLGGRYAGIARRRRLLDAPPRSRALTITARRASSSPREPGQSRKLSRGMYRTVEIVPSITDSVSGINAYATAARRTWGTFCTLDYIQKVSVSSTYRTIFHETGAGEIGRRSYLETHYRYNLFRHMTNDSNGRLAGSQER